MMLFHTTPEYNRCPIERMGILTRLSQGKMKAVWLHTQDKTSWAYLHCVRRHGGKVENVITFAVEVDDSLVKRSCADGLFYTLEDVPPEAIRAVMGFEFVSRSPLEDNRCATAK